MAKVKRSMVELMRALVAAARVSEVTEALLAECESRLRAQKKQVTQAAKASARSGKSGRKPMPEERRLAILSHPGDNYETADAFGVNYETVRRVRKAAREASSNG